MLSAAGGGVAVGLHPDRRGVEGGVELHRGLAFFRGLADGDGVLGVVEPFGLELRQVGIGVVVLRLVIVADHQVEEIGADLGEHVVVELLLALVLAAGGEAGDVAFVEDRAAAHAFDGLAGLVGEDPDGGGLGQGGKGGEQGGEGGAERGHS
jgi:hypothetical protein